MTSATRRTTAALASTLVLALWTVSAQQSPGRWDTEKYAKLPQPAEEYTPGQLNAKRTAGAAVELGGKIYFIGGSTDSVGPDGRTQNGGLVVGTNEAYDLATNRWEARKPMPTPRNHPAIGVVNGRIYLIGGRITANNIGGYVPANVDGVQE